MPGDDASKSAITGLLQAWGRGNHAALEKLVPLVDAELRRLARRYMGRERAGHTLQPTALINEVYLRLIDWGNISACRKSKGPRTVIRDATAAHPG